MKYRDLLPEFTQGHCIARKAWHGSKEIYLHLKSQVIYLVEYSTGDHRKIVRKSLWIPGKEPEENDWIVLDKFGPT